MRSPDATPARPTFLAVPAAAVGPELRRHLQLVPSSQLVPVEDLHVTLHFLGRQPSAWIERIAAVCDWPAIASFRLDLAGAGRFAGERAQQVLWVGVERSPQLAALHALLAARLAALGLPLEARPWQPHLTVARGDAVSVESAEAFVGANRELRLSLAVDEFGLFVTEPNGAVSRYRCLRSWPLSHDAPRG